MNSEKINSTADVYQFVERLKLECAKAHATDLLEQLDGAVSLGSSGLEILGAIRQTLIINRATITRLLGATSSDQINQINAFVDKAFGS
jgi:hypothetical protein